MDKNDEKSAKESCCESGGKCGKCCPGKAALVLILLLIGGLIGYAMGRCHKMGCAYTPPCPMGAMAPSAK